MLPPSAPVICPKARIQNINPNARPILSATVRCTVVITAISVIPVSTPLTKRARATSRKLCERLSAAIVATMPRAAVAIRGRGRKRPKGQAPSGTPIIVPIPTALILGYWLARPAAVVRGSKR